MNEKVNEILTILTPLFEDDKSIQEVILFGS